MNEVETLKKSLAEANAEIDNLQLRLSNALLLLKKEMTASGSLPKPGTDSQAAHPNLTTATPPVR